MREAALTDEAGRLSALRRYEILDTAAEPQFDKITTLVKTVLGVPISAVSLVDDDRQWFKASCGLDVDRTSRDVAFCAHTIRDRCALVVPDATLDPRFRDNPLVTGDPFIVSYAGVPLKTPEGYNVGALCAIDTVPRAFTVDQIGILSSFAALVVDEFELRTIAKRDHLTGLLTRRATAAQAETAIASRDAHGRPAALVLLDIDHFKAINDSYGHPVGDIVLQKVARVCKAMLRAGDALGRVGGEEFALILPETDADRASDIAERLRREIADMPCDHDPRGVTASFGVAVLDDSIMTFVDWMEAADEPLYAAKRGGRNRCVRRDRSPRWSDAPVATLRAAVG